ncbi:16S rRNA (adenine(1518)-N(6)/adenine(1519)-N(6))-dimethyltransferase RsmA [Rhodomicrobium sp.]|uniref:16S rRNA (adenine(1518)-N(6)/adenine(1519)-N(6))- dimethyltransferase RsmA n=1 Tax=Rhodomicrobium sp. TaxID=2720632 RepID=UPI0039E48071
MSAAAIEALPPLREVIKDASLSARKSLGQNFILDLNVTRRIARAAGPLDGATVLEIGPGPGGLTRALLIEGASRAIAIERDERFRPALDQIAEASGGRFGVTFADAMSIDYPAFATETGANRIVANLPYNIATPLIVGWLTETRWPPWFDRIVVMVQKEVAERLAAEVGSDHYGRLAVIAQFRARPRILFTLPPSVFTPPPKVASALVEIVPRPQAPDAVPTLWLEKVTAAAFGQRRKMLRSSLASLGADTARLLAEAGIDPAERAERLAVEDFLRIAKALQSQRGG